MTEFRYYKTLPDIDRREVLRYAGVREENDEVRTLLDECIKECEGVLNYSVCFCKLKFAINPNLCEFDGFFVVSESLSRNLLGSECVYLFLASIGHSIDRLIAKYTRTKPSKALIINAIGTERVEALADTFVREVEAELSMQSRPRFSPGYGDLELSLQETIFEILRPEKQLSVYLSQSLIMSPSKSVTAFVGFGEAKRIE